MRKGAKFNLELALMADGVPAAEVYDVLSTPEAWTAPCQAGHDQVRGDLVGGRRPAPQLLADGEVSMAYAFNGRIFNAAQADGQPFEIIWDAQIYEMEGWVVPKGAPNLEQAMEFVAWTTAPAPQARAAEFISYGPPRRSAAAMVGNIEGTEEPMGPNLPTFDANMAGALASDLDFGSTATPS
ncbi:extracellular solute-binding protein [Paracoccus marcusii]|uniref:extracellular solute-binding protein n=1 Tax=Paracoccus marcusii TaxID=59779 RepID=UPI0039C855F0